MVSTAVPISSRKVSDSPSKTLHAHTDNESSTGDYITKINTNLLANDMPTSDLYVKQSLWACIEHGDIKLLQFCAAGCVGGDKKDDYCTGTGKRDGLDGEIFEGDETDEELFERNVAMEWEA